MSKTRIPHNCWVLVCDGAKALILRNEGDTKRLSLIPVDVASEHHPPNRDLGSDRQGRVYQSHGGARSTTQETDWHDQAEEAFLSQIAGKLDSLMRDSDVTDLVLVAPPRVLGILRKCFSPFARGTVTAEVAKDLVKFPIPEIEHYLSE